MSGPIVISDEQLRTVESIRSRYAGVTCRADGSLDSPTTAAIAGELAAVGLKLRSITVTWGDWGALLHMDIEPA